MAVLSRAALDAYVDARELLARTVRLGLSEQLQYVDFSDIAQSRKQVIEIMNAALVDGTNASASLAAEFYDLVRELSIGERIGALALSGRDPAATEGFVRAAIEQVIRGNIFGFLTSCLERSDYEIKRAAGNCIYQNGFRDVATVRYARVPHGSNTCPFCNMLASRGAVYLTAESAGADNPDHYHSICRCAIVPMFDVVATRNPSRNYSIATQVEGYDPDALFDKYQQDLDDGILSRTKLAIAAERAHEANKGHYKVVK